jgi:hypothetical protein
MKVCALEKTSIESFIGMLENDEYYVAFNMEPDGTWSKRWEYPKADYEDYRHFVGVMGKFVPETFFLAKPIEIDEVSLIEIERAYGLLPPF